MLVTLAVLAAFGVLGAVLVLVGPAGAGSVGKGGRVRRLLYIVGVSLLSTFTVLVMLGAISWAVFDQVGNAFEDTFSDSTPDSSQYKDGPEFGENNEILPETEEEWEMFCSPESGISEENRELYCF